MSFQRLILSLLYLVSQVLSTNFWPEPCYKYVDYARKVVQSVGSNYEELCPTTSAFSQALKAASSCSSSAATAQPFDSTVQPSAEATLISSAVSYCAGHIGADALAQAWSTGSICCGSDTVLQQSFSCGAAGKTRSECAFFNAGPTLTANSTSPNTLSTSTLSPASTITSGPLQSSTASTSNSNPSTSNNTGLIIGATVGVTIGVVLFASVLAFFIYRRRKHRKQRTLEPTERPEEKAQLHSDDVKPKEMPGAPIVKVRSVGGLEEMDGISYIKHSELPATEEVGRELDTQQHPASRYNQSESGHSRSGFSGSTLGS